MDRRNAIKALLATPLFGWLADGTSPKLILQTGRLHGKRGERQALTDDERTELIESVRGIYKGVANYNEPLILNCSIEGAEYIRGPKPTEMDFCNWK